MKLLPSPKELGFSSNAALQSSLLTPNATDTWEEYYKKCRELHPIKWKLSETIKYFTRWPRVKDAFYWLRTHTYNRYHILDLRDAEPENKDGYKWGWIDRTNALPLAAFLVLRKFVEEERPWNCSECIKKLEVDGDENGELLHLYNQQKDYEEIMSLYNWWVKDRLEENERFEKNINDYYDDWKKDPTEDNKQKWFHAEDARNRREEEQLIRLVKIRNCLWT